MGYAISNGGFHDGKEMQESQPVTLHIQNILTSTVKCITKHRLKPYHLSICYLNVQTMAKLSLLYSVHAIKMTAKKKHFY